MTDLRAEQEPGSWRTLLGREHAPVAMVLAGGVLLEASNVYLTTSLLPTIVADIGGAQYYAWTMTTFLVASVISAMLVSRTLTTKGSVNAYVLAFSLFGAGSLLCAASPDMGIFLLGRAVQGLGGGLLAGLGYALIQRSLPEQLWARGAALVSAMWGWEICWVRRSGACSVRSTCGARPSRSSRGSPSHWRLWSCGSSRAPPRLKQARRFRRSRSCS